MKKENQKEELRKIEKEIDDLFLSPPAMKLPRSAIVQYLLITYELAGWLPKLSGTHILFKNRFEDSAIIDNLKDSLTHSINWISGIVGNSDRKIISFIDIPTISMSKDLFDLALSYHGVVSAYTMWSRGVASATIKDDKTLSFKYDEEEGRYDVLERKLYINKLDEVVAQTMHSHNEKIIKQKIIVEKSVKQTGKHTISYSLKDVDCGVMIKLAKSILQEQTIPPDDWRFYDIPKDHFVTFWSALISVSMLHSVAVIYALINLSLENNLLVAIIVRSKNDWIRQLSRWTSISKDTIKK